MLPVGSCPQRGSIGRDAVYQRHAANPGRFAISEYALAPTVDIGAHTHFTLSFEPTLTDEEAIVHAITVDVDECIACPTIAHVRAYMYAQLASGKTIALCAHHGREHTDALIAQGATILDLSHMVHA